MFFFQLIMKVDELTVPRRVIVDLVRYKSLKTIQRGVNPNSIRVACGGLHLQTLGTLSEKSDQKYALIPIGYRYVLTIWLLILYQIRIDSNRIQVNSDHLVTNLAIKCVDSDRIKFEYSTTNLKTVFIIHHFLDLQTF